MDEKAMKEKLKQDIIMLDKKHDYHLGYWGPIDFKSVRVETFGNSFRVLFRFWHNIKKGDDDYKHGVGMSNERETGGFSFVVPHDYSIEMLAVACARKRR